MIAVRNDNTETKVCLVCGERFTPTVPDEDVCEDCQLSEDDE